MTIINIWAKFDKLQEYLSNNSTINALFPWGIYAGKPLNVDSQLSLYFSLATNNPLVENDRKGQKNLKKRALLDFVLTANKKDTPEVVIYEALDILSNEIVWSEIDLSWFIINWIQEGNQTGVLYDTNENPLLIAQFQVDYKNKY